MDEFADIASMVGIGAENEILAFEAADCLYLALSLDAFVQDGLGNVVECDAEWRQDGGRRCLVCGFLSVDFAGGSCLSFLLCLAAVYVQPARVCAFWYDGCEGMPLAAAVLPSG